MNSDEMLEPLEIFEHEGSYWHIHASGENVVILYYEDDHVDTEPVVWDEHRIPGFSNKEALAQYIYESIEAELMTGGPADTDDDDDFLEPLEAEETDEEESPTRETLYTKELLIPLSPDDDTPPEAIFTTDTGETLLYAGRLSSFYGLPGGGKTWLGLIAALQCLELGGRVLWLDYEDTPQLMAARGKALKVDLSEHEFGYSRATPADFVMLHRWLRQGSNNLVVIDSAERAGCASDGSKVGQWYDEWIIPWLKTETAVLIIDHVPKRAEERPRGAIGSQAKLAQITGVAYRIDGIPWTRSLQGKVQLVVDKDRPGYIGSTGTIAATVTVDPDILSETLDVSIKHQGTHEQAQAQAGSRNDASSNDIRILRALKEFPGYTGYRPIGDDTHLSHMTVKRRIISLRQQGFIQADSFALTDEGLARVLDD